MIRWEKFGKVLSNPNWLTMFRIIAAPGVVILLLFPNRFTTAMAMLLFSAAAISDYLDGYFARRWGMISNFGKVMDPVADKLLVSASLIMLSSLGWIPAWVVCVIIGRELAITGLRVVVIESGEDISASWLGKYKTGFQIAAIICLLIHFPYFGIHFHAIGLFFLWGALVFTIWSGIDYFIKFRKLIDL
jgi:CDP-diacylglycerol--glycerol-3-phosphate 3-phosphatidyltransferase